MKARHKSCLWILPSHLICLGVKYIWVEYKTFIINSLNNLNTVQIANHELFTYFFLVCILTDLIVHLTN